ncbi:hypothetical protein GGX14DRAFT_699985, partial [Mycena pura]
MQAPEPESSQLEVAGVVCFYIVAALVMVFVNKAVLNHTPDLPFTLLFLQVFLAVLLLRVLAYANGTRLQGLRFVPAFKLPMLTNSRGMVLDLLPYLTVGITGLVFNTLCLANVDAAFFQIARGLLLPLTIAVSAVHTGVRPRATVLAAAFAVTFGFLVGTAPTFYRTGATSLSQESAVALLYGAISSFVLAVHAVLKKTALQHVGKSVITLSYIGNMFMSIMLVPCIILHGELGALHSRYHDANMDWTTFIVGSLVTGVFGFLLGISHSLSIKVTSPVTHMFSSAAKGVIQTLLGMWIFSDVLTQSRLYSIAIITGGTVYYTWEQTKPKREALPESDAEKQLPVERPIDGEKRVLDGNDAGKSRKGIELALKRPFFS